MEIDSFTGSYFFLSNFYSREVEFDGVLYPSSEHAYQAAKTLDMKKRRKIRAAKSPGEAKKMGRQLVLRENWDNIKYDIMVTILRDKFTRHDDLKQKLIATGSAILIEGNNWGDKIWGCIRKNKNKPWVGKNLLGKALMQIRKEFSDG